MTEDPDMYCPDCGGHEAHEPGCPMPAKLKEST